jgi:hypothetical protein
LTEGCDHHGDRDRWNPLSQKIMAEHKIRRKGLNSATLDHSLQLIPVFIGFPRLIAGQVGRQQNLAASFKRKNAYLAQVLGDVDRPIPGNCRVLFNKLLYDASREQHSIYVVSQRRPVRAGTVNTLDRIANVKSIKRHRILMPILDVPF